MAINFLIGKSGTVPVSTTIPRHPAKFVSLSILIENGTKKAEFKDRVLSLELPLSSKKLLGNFSKAEEAKTFSGSIVSGDYGAINFKVAEATQLSMPLSPDNGGGARLIGLTLRLDDIEIVPNGVKKKDHGIDAVLPDSLTFQNLPKQAEGKFDCRVLAALELFGDAYSGMGKGAKLTNASATFVRTVENDLQCPLYHVAELSLLTRKSEQSKVGELWDLGSVGLTIELANGNKIVATGFLVESYSLSVAKGSGDDTISVTESLNLRFVKFGFMDEKFEDKDLLASVYKPDEKVDGASS